MPRYLVNHNYRSFSDGRAYGPFEAGQTVELVETDAEWVNRDSPGCLSPEADEDAGPGKQTRPHKAAKTRAAS